MPKRKKSASHFTSQFKWKVASRLILICVIIVLLNFFVQIFRKPGELLNFTQLGRAKTLEQTWKIYRSYFKKYSIEFITPEYLAALAQVESSGNPWATPKWAFRFSTDWESVYSPESTALGLYQFTDATYQNAKKLCVRGHRVLRDSRWDDPASCWFNWTYLRISASDSIEMAAAQLYSETTEVLRGPAQTRLKKVTDIQKRQLASVIHLCGRGRGEAFFKNGFSLQTIGTCGDYNISNYLKKVSRFESQINELATIQLQRESK